MVTTVTFSYSLILSMASEGDISMSSLGDRHVSVSAHDCNILVASSSSSSCPGPSTSNNSNNSSRSSCSSGSLGDNSILVDRARGLDAILPFDPINILPINPLIATSSSSCSSSSINSSSSSSSTGQISSSSSREVTFHGPINFRPDTYLNAFSEITNQGIYIQKQQNEYLSAMKILIKKETKIKELANKIIYCAADILDGRNSTIDVEGKANGEYVFQAIIVLQALTDRLAPLKEIENAIKIKTGQQKVQENSGELKAKEINSNVNEMDFSKYEDDLKKILDNCSRGRVDLSRKVRNIKKVNPEQLSEIFSKVQKILNKNLSKDIKENGKVKEEIGDRINKEDEENNEDRKSNTNKKNEKSENIENEITIREEIKTLITDYVLKKLICTRIGIDVSLGLGPSGNLGAGMAVCKDVFGRRSIKWVPSYGLGIKYVGANISLEKSTYELALNGDKKVHNPEYTEVVPCGLGASFDTTEGWEGRKFKGVGIGLGGGVLGKRFGKPRSVPLICPLLSWFAKNDKKFARHRLHLPLAEL